MTKLTKNEKTLRKASKKWKNFLAEGAFKKTVNESIDFRKVHFAAEMEPEELELLNIPEEEYKTKSKEEVEAIVAAVEKAHDEAQYGVELRSTATRAENEPIMKVINSKMKAGYKLTGEKGYSHSSGAEEDEEYRMTYSNDMPSRSGELKEWDEDDTYHFDQDKHGPEEEYTAEANFKMGDVVKVMNRGKPKFDEPEELRCRIGTVVGMDGRQLTLKFENGEEATIAYFNARRDEHGLWDSKSLYNCPEEQVSEGVEPREGDYVNIIGGVLTGAVGKVIELTTTGGIGIEGGLPALVVRLTKAADKRIYGGKGDEVIVQPKFVEVDSGLYGAQVNEARMGEYGKMDAEDGNPPTKIGRGNEEYMAAYNAVLVARGEEPLDIQKPDQAFLDALRSGNLEETVRKAVAKVLTEKKKFNLKEFNVEMSLQSKAKGKAMGLLQTAKAMDQGPPPAPNQCWSFAAAVAKGAGEIVDLMVELEGFQASRSASLEEQERQDFQRGAFVNIVDGSLKGATGKVVQPVTASSGEEAFVIELYSDAKMKVYGKRGDNVIATADKMRLSDPRYSLEERDAGMELYDIDEKKSLKEEVIEDFEIELEGGITFADVEEAGLVTPGVDSVIDNGDGYAQVYSEPGAMAKMAKTLEAMTGVMVSPKSHGPVDERSDLIKEKDQKEFAKVKAIATDMMVLSARSRIKPTLGSVQSALDVQKIPSQMEDNKLIVADKYVVAEKNVLPETAESLSFTRYAIDYLSNLPGEQQDLPIG